MAKKSKIDKIKAGVFSRQIQVAKLGLSTGTKVAKNSLGNIFRKENQAWYENETSLIEEIEKWTHQLGELKGSLMKAGQALSMYGEHILPEQANNLLKSLQSDSPIVAWDFMKEQLEKESGKAACEKLEIDPEPIGSASIGQVHKARHLESNQWIALKIQYPGVEKAIDSDLKALKKILSLSSLLPASFDPEPIFTEVREMLHQEANYEKEKSHTDYFREILQDDPRYAVAKIWPEFSSRRVLAMDYLPGRRFDSDDVQNLPQERRNALAYAYLELYLKEIFEFGRVQTDPHLGNYNVQLGQNKDEDRLVLYDFGAVREVGDSFLVPYRKMISRIILGDFSAFDVAARELGLIEDGDSEKLKDIFFEFCQLIVEPFSDPAEAKSEFFDDTGVYDFGRSNLPQRVVSLGRDLIKNSSLRTPPREIIFLDRKLGGSYTILSVLKAKFKPRPAIRPYLMALKN